MITDRSTGKITRKKICTGFGAVHDGGLVQLAGNGRR